MSNKKPKFRHELKYLLNLPEAALLGMRLSALMERDPNVGETGEYMIRSLYFDDYANSAYEEKDMGVFARKKYRIRVYNCQDRVIHLERKTKRDQYIFKESATLTRAQTDELLEGRYGFLEKSSSPLLQEFYYECTTRIMRPRVMVDYDREPFIMDEGNVRITFDRHVRGSTAFDLFDPQLATMEVVPANKLILEVKYTEFLPKPVQRLLPLRSSEWTAASKYVMCCDACPEAGRIMERTGGLLWRKA